MPKSSNQKSKLLFLRKILLEKTDEEHCLPTQQIIEELERYGVQAERKSIYSDMEALRLYGLDVEERRGKNGGYYVANRQFELPELKLLVDAVQSSKFITHRKSNQLIKKIEGLASGYQAQQLQRQVFVSNRIKTMNESIYYNVDKIHAAISSNNKISFQYYEWKITGKDALPVEKQMRHQGVRYVLSPWALSWDDENYYMIAFDSTEQIIKHFRVDKMSSIEITEQTRDGQEEFSSFDVADYVKKTFGMFGGTQERVKLEFANHLIGVVVDRFGKDIAVSLTDEEHFCITVDVAVSPHFLSWVFLFGQDVKILEPQNVREKMRQMCVAVLEQSEE